MLPIATALSVPEAGPRAALLSGFLLTYACVCKHIYLFLVAGYLLGGEVNTFSLKSK